MHRRSEVRGQTAEANPLVSHFWNLAYAIPILPLQSDLLPPTSVLLHRVLSGVPFSRVNDDLQLLALLVANFQRTTVRRLEFDFQLAIRAVQFGVGGVVTDVVLVADVGRDVVEKLGQFALEAREVRASAGQVSEGVELIIGLQPIDLLDPSRASPAGAVLDVLRTALAGDVVIGGCGCRRGRSWRGREQRLR